MNRTFRRLTYLLCVSTFMMVLSCEASAQKYLQKLDAVRTEMTKIGSSLPDMIRKAEPRDIRTLERVFEINNYALVTIEAYLKMIKIAISSGRGLDDEVMEVLNGWLKFISHYTEYDIKYIDEALSETETKAVVNILNAEKESISRLREASQSAIKENSELVPAPQ